MSDYQTIRYRRHGDIGTLTLARPAKRNAQNPLMWEELARLGAELVPDETLRCLVVTGEGPTFSAGIDLVEGMAGLLADTAEQPHDERLSRRGPWRWRGPLAGSPTSAAPASPPCAATPTVPACSWHWRATSASSRRAPRWACSRPAMGSCPDMGATVRLPRIVGESRARELILLGDIIDAAEALRIGLANRVVADGDLDAAAADLAGRLATQPPIAVRGARRAIDAAWHRGPEESHRVGRGRADPLPRVRRLQGRPPGNGRRTEPTVAGTLDEDELRPDERRCHRLERDAGPTMRLPSSAHTSRPWRIHDLTHDFRLEDVWALPTPGGPDDFPRLVAGIASGDLSQGSSRAARTLWAIRWKVGELLGWDGPDAGVGSRVPTLRDRLPADLRDARIGPGLRRRSGSPRSTCSRTSSPQRSPTGPCTGSCISGGFRTRGAGYRGQMAVLVKPNGLLGTGYMAAIRPFRHLIVYPQMMQQIERSWRAIAHDQPPAQT